jgi:hypothetical protein
MYCILDIGSDARLGEVFVGSSLFCDKKLRFPHYHWALLFYEVLYKDSQYWCEMCVFAPDGAFPVTGRSKRAWVLSVRGNNW